MKTNFTPITHLIPKLNQSQTSHPTGPESEPLNNHLSEKITVVEKKDQISNTSSVNIQENNVKASPIDKNKKLTIQPSTQKSNQFSRLYDIKTPIADDKVLSGKNAPVTSSIRWLSELAIYILRKAHIKIKRIGGKAVRVMSR